MPEMTSYEPGTPSWVDVASPDVDSAATFYEGLFGWETGEAGNPEETGGYRMFSKDGKVVAGIGPVQNPEQPSAWTSYVTVEDADATAAKIKELGGQVLMDPMEVMTAGRMAILMDPDGAVFAIWQPRDHIGAQLVNEPGSLIWNELRSRNTEGAKSFYGEVFDWDGTDFAEMEGYTVWTIGGTGPENGMGGMIDMATISMPDEVPPHWDVTFAVDDADATAAKCEELGGKVTTPPMDLPVGRMAGLQDPAGATFSVIEPPQRQ